MDRDSFFWTDGTYQTSLYFIGETISLFIFLVNAKGVKFQYL